MKSSRATTIEADVARMALEAAGVPPVVVGIGVGMEGGAGRSSSPLWWDWRSAGRFSVHCVRW